MDEYCRVCMGSEFLKDIFMQDQLFKDAPSLVKMLSECVNAEIKPDDKRSKSICISCIQETQIAYKLKRNYERSNQRVIVKQQILEDDELIKSLETEEWELKKREEDVKKEEIEKNTQTAKTPQPNGEENTRRSLRVKRKWSKNDMNTSKDQLDKENTSRDSLDKSKSREKIPRSNGSSNDNATNTKSKSKENVPQVTVSTTDNAANTKSKSKENVPQVTVSTTDNAPNTKSTDSTSDNVPIVSLYLKDIELKCKICGKLFKTHYNLQLHSYFHKKKRGSKLGKTGFYRCLVCSKTFPSLTKLEIHDVVHTGERPYKCTNCNKAYSTACSLAKHLRKEEAAKKAKLKTPTTELQGINSINSPIDKSSTTRESLETIINFPDGPSDFKCILCPQTFTTRSSLKIHTLDVHIQNKTK